MVRQEITLFEDSFEIKSYTEHFNQKKIIYEEYNEKGYIIYKKTPTLEYDMRGEQGVKLIYFMDHIKNGIKMVC